MARLIKNIGIIGKQEFLDRPDLVPKFKTAMAKLGCKLIYINQSPDNAILGKCDLVLTLGGDGTILKVARSIAGFKRRPFILGVNMGIVGFLSELPPDDVIKELPSFINGDCKKDMRRLLEVEVFRNNRKIFKSYALNDAVINQGPFARMLNLNIQINDKLMSEFRGDGVIVATTTGSTGHSLAAGGSIIHPRLEAFIITPLIPASLSMRPIIVPDNRIIKVQLTARKPLQTEVRVTVDGQVSAGIKYGDKVVVKRTEASITFLRKKDKNFYSTLRQKLHWGESF